jgi:poly-gamma-glutamate synthesis protein (capsule biosynthesis protein)
LEPWASKFFGPHEVELFGAKFVSGDAVSVSFEPDRHDLDQILLAVRQGKQHADTLILTAHVHDEGPDPSTPPAFLRDVVHEAIDGGADVFVGHGPQVPLGIEIYQGRPIFHGLGTFLFQIETLRYLPAEAYERYGLDERATPADFIRARYADDTRGHTADPLQWEQVFAVCEFAAESLKEIRLYPLELGYGLPRSQRGRPLLAAGEAAERVIGRVAELSRRYGTHVAYRDGVGVIAA